MASKRQTKILINSIDVSSFLIDWEREETFGETIPHIELTFSRNISDLVTLGTDLTLVVYEGFTLPLDYIIWNGFVETYKPDGAKVKIIGRNNLADVVRKEITHVYDKTVPGDAAYPNGKISDIALDILTTYCGLTADATTVQDSGVAITLSKFICNHADPLERLKKLQEVLGWVLYYDDYTDKGYFEPKGYTTNATTFTVGTNIVGIPKWTESKDQMVNDLTLEGAVLNEPRSEVKSGNASDLTFTLTTTEIPSHFEVYYGVGTNFATTAPLQNQQKVGVPEGTTIGTYDYTFDLKKRSITFTSFTPASGTNNILIKFWIETPNPIHRVNDASITAYGRYQKTITLTDVVNVDDAENRCSDILEKFSQPFVTGKFQVIVSDSSLKVGQYVTIVDTINQPNINGNYVITKHIKRWPGNIDEFVVGDKQWMPNDWYVNVLERVKRLEESLVVDSTVVSEIKDNSMGFCVVPDYQVLTFERNNDTPMAGISPYNLMYATNETAILNDFEDTTKWADTGITTAKATMSTTLGTSGDYLTGTGAIRFTGTVSGSFGLRNTSSLGDLSSCVGTGSGTPSQGTFGVWLNTTQTSNFTATVQLRIGTNTSNYFTYNSKTYAQKVAVDTTTWNLDSGWNLLLFDANVPTSKTGTITWTNASYMEIKGTVSGATVWENDYATVSKNDTISLCGLGYRPTTYLTTTYTY